MEQRSGSIEGCALVVKQYPSCNLLTRQGLSIPRDISVSTETEAIRDAPHTGWGPHNRGVLRSTSWSAVGDGDAEQALPALQGAPGWPGWVDRTVGTPIPARARNGPGRLSEIWNDALGATRADVSLDPGRARCRVLDRTRRPRRASNSGLVSGNGRAAACGRACRRRLRRRPGHASRQASGHSILLRSFAHALMRELDRHIARARADAVVLLGSLCAVEPFTGLSVSNGRGVCALRRGSARQNAVCALMG